MEVAGRDGVARTVRAERLHAFDSLRGVMMLLGLVLHAAMSYVTYPADEAWPFQDPKTDVSFDFLVAWIHAFRMPVFFVAAGFFAALLHTGRGPGGLLRNRLQRVGVPLVCAWCLCLPLVVGAAIYGQAQLGLLPDLEERAIPLRELLDELLHLWFLYHLLIFYAVAVVVVWLLRRLPPRPAARGRGALVRWIPHSATPLALAVLSYFPLMTMESGGVDISGSFLPALNTLATYALFFTFGWLLFGERDGLPWFSVRTWRHGGLGLAFFVIYLFAATIALAPGGSRGAFLVAMAAFAATMWYWVYAFLGLFLRYCGGENRYARYMADASYWMYLVHLPLIMWFSALLLRAAIPAGLKFALVLAAATAVALLSYRYLVRSTAIGAVLNGRRYPAGWP